MTNTLLIREYVKQILIEDDFGGGDAGAGGAIGGGLAGYTGVGINIVSDDLITKTFISGWKDLFKTATAATKSLSASAIGTMKTALATVTDAIFPFYKAQYSNIFKQLHDTQDKIRKEHAPVYNSIKNALGENDDFLVSAALFSPDKFFATSIQNPSAFVTGVGIAKAPDAIAKMFDTLTGGGMLGKAIESQYAGDKLPKVKKVLQKTLSKDTYGMLFGTGMGVPSDFSARELKQLVGFPLNEEEQANNQAMAMKILMNPQIIRQVLNSDELKKLSRQTQQVTQETLDKIVKVVQQVSQVHNLNDYSRIVGKHFEVKQEELPTEEQNKLLEAIKQNVKKMYVEALTVEKNHIIKVTSNDAPLAQAYEKAIRAIETL
jgi:hypothetical protein